MQALPAFDYLRPADLAAALQARHERPASRFIAGGTDLIANIRRRIAEPEALIDLGGIAELKGIAAGPQGLRIGAGVTLAALVDHEAIRVQWPAVAAAAGAVAGATHRETATVGGNLCLDTRCVFYNQSDWWRRSNAFCLKLKGDTCHVAPTGTRCHAAFSGDLAPALLVHGAEVELAGPAARRRIPLEQLYADDGAKHLTLAPEEVVVSVHLPARPWPGAYEKARLRAAIDFPLAGVAVALTRDGDTLAGLLPTMAREASVAVSGNTGGAALKTTVLPFILRGVSLLGIESDLCPHPRRLAAWQRLVEQMPAETLDKMTQEASLDDVPRLAQDIVQGKIQGRMVIRVGR